MHFVKFLINLLSDIQHLVSSFWQEKLIIEWQAKYGPLERERNLVKASLTDFFKVAVYDPYNKQCKSSSVVFL